MRCNCNKTFLQILIVPKNENYAAKQCKEQYYHCKLGREMKWSAYSK